MRSHDQRDRAVERLLRRPSAVSAVRPTSSCVDAETLASWHDGRLPVTHASAVEVHLSTCGDCQALAAAFARSLPTPPARTPLLERWQFRWLVPLAATAAAVALWVAVPERSVPRPDLAREERAPIPNEQRSQQAQRPIEVTSGRPAAASEPAPQGPAELASRTLNEERGVSSARRADKAEMKEATGTAESDLARLAELPHTALNDSPAAPAAVAPPLPPSPGPDVFARTLPATPQKPEIAQPEASRDQLAARHADGDAGARANAAERAQSLEQVRQRSTLSARVAESRRAGIVEWSSPDRDVRWRITAGGSVERSTLESALWEPVAVGRERSVTAGAAPSPLVCWLVGRAGVVMRTTDGRRFERVSFPSPIDLVGVRADGASVAIVTASDGRSYSTSDGGATWKRAN